MTVVDDPHYTVDERDLDQPSASDQTRLNRFLFGDRNRRDRRRRRKGQGSPRLWLPRLMRLVLLASLAVGVAGGTKALLPTPDPADGEAGELLAPAPVEIPRDLGVGGFAELYIAAWLGAGRDNADALTPYYSTPVDLIAVEAGRLWASRTTVVEVTEASDDYWAVTVAADVLVADEEGSYQPGGIRYYTVAIIETDAGFGAAGLPAQIPPPATLDAPELAIDVLQAPTGDLEPLAEALEGFFDAFLAGSGDLVRYVSPETSLAPISPPPFADTEVRAIGARPEVDDLNRYLVRVEIMATDPSGNSQILHYTVIIAQRARRWEVSELMAAPPLK